MDTLAKAFDAYMEELGKFEATDRKRLEGYMNSIAATHSTIISKLTPPLPIVEEESAPEENTDAETTEDTVEGVEEAEGTEGDSEADTPTDAE